MNLFGGEEKFNQFPEYDGSELDHMISNVESSVQPGVKPLDFPIMRGKTQYDRQFVFIAIENKEYNKKFSNQCNDHFISLYQKWSKNFSGEKKCISDEWRIAFLSRNHPLVQIFGERLINEYGEFVKDNKVDPVAKLNILLAGGELAGFKIRKEF